jgi:CheY-like chemotaxis protein
MHGNGPGRVADSPIRTRDALMAGLFIWCVDDDAATCASLSDILTDLGYGVSVACDGHAALQLVQQQPYGLALLDYRMPGMDGLELYRRIRQLRPSVVGVLVTACAANNVMDEARAVGVRNILPKPVDFDELLPLAEEIVGNAALHPPVAIQPERAFGGDEPAEPALLCGGYDVRPLRSGFPGYRRSCCRTRCR